MRWDTGEFRWNSLTMRDMQQFVSDLYSFIYILMVLKVMEKAKQPPFKIKLPLGQSEVKSGDGEY